MVHNGISGKKAVQFGAFELNLETGELRKHGVKMKLQGKPFHILQALVERPGEVVSREELRNRLWPADTFVDFESGLNTAANRLRIALGDSADSPRYVETLARSGYRFIAPVNAVTPAPVEHTTIETPAPAVIVPTIPQTPAATSSPASLPESRRARNPILWAAAAVCAVASIAGWYWMRQRPAAPIFSQVTFRRGMVGGARFAPDGQSVIYSARWGGEEATVYVASTVSPESRKLDVTRSRVASVSRSGELALLSYDPSLPFAGARLSRVPINGGAPLALAEGIGAADWLPDGEQLAAVRNGNRGAVIEFPLGKVIYRSNYWITDLRVSPDGGALAFMEHPLIGDDAGMVRIVDTDGVAKTLADGWASEAGLAWSPSGKEVWFTACRAGIMRSLWAATLKGKLRLVSSFPGTLHLFDISRSGRVLLSRDNARLTMTRSVIGEKEEQDISWFDWSRPQDISADGNLILFDETGQGGGAHYTVYLHRYDTHSTMRVSEGRALSLSPDGKWAATAGTRDRTYLSLVPLSTGSLGAARRLSGEGIEYQWARYFPDGKRLLVAGSYPGRPVRLFVQPVEGGKPAPIQPEVYLDFVAISPDGRRIAGLNADHRIQLLDVDGRNPRLLPLSRVAKPVRWSADGSALFVAADIGAPGEILRVDLATGKDRIWKTISPADPAGVMWTGHTAISADERSCVYASARILSELYAVDGWI